MSFSENVLRICSRVPRGKVVTYKEVAKELNSPNSFRAVGNALNKNKYLISIPCHRVVQSNGFVGGYVKGVKQKIILLKKEGVIVSNKGNIDLNKFLYKF